MSSSDKSAAHIHSWTSVMHIDGCHYYGATYACRCGATASTMNERDPTGDSYSLIWMDDEGSDPCARCDELRAGAKVKHRTTITLKDGTLEKDETVEREQGVEV